MQRKHGDEFVRRLRGLERAPLRMPNANVIMAAQIAGEITKDQLTSAVAKARQRHPLLRARVAVRRDGTAHFTSEGVPDIPVRVVDCADPDAWQDHVQEEIRIPFQCEIGPLIRLCLLQSAGRSTLVLISHHMSCDGLSLVYLTRDLLNYLGDPQRPVQRLPVPPEMNADNLPVSLRHNLLLRIFLNRISKKWQRKKITFTQDDVEALHRVFWAQHRTRTLAWHLNASRTSQLVTACRRESVTVNTAIATAFLAAQREVQGAAPEYRNTTGIAVSLRDRLRQSPGEGFGFYAASVRPHLVYVPETRFWDMAREFHTEIKSLLTDEQVFASQRVGKLPPTLFDALSFAKYGLLEDKLVTRLLKRTQKDGISMGLLISNLGRFDIPIRYGALYLEHLYGPFVYSDNDEKYLGVLTMNDQLHFALSFGETDVAPHIVERVRDRAMDYLKAAC